MWLDFFLWDIKNWLLERVFWIVVAHVIESCDTLRHISFSFVSLTMLFSNPKKVQNDKINGSFSFSYGGL